MEQRSSIIPVAAKAPYVASCPAPAEQPDRFARSNTAHPAMRALKELAASRGRCVGPARSQSRAAPAPCCGPVTVDPVEVLAGEVRLGAMPELIFELQRLIDDPGSTPDDMARVVSLDPGLSAYLLRVVNSALYRQPSRIDTISRAIFVLGTRRLSLLAMGASALRGLGGKNVPGLDLERFWGHSVACGVVARALAEHIGRMPSERFFIAGLLHDLGDLALFSIRPQAALLVRQTMERDGLLLAEAEQQLLGFDHARLGAMLLRKWNFPFTLARAVLQHHAPLQGNTAADGHEVHDEPIVVHLADVISTALGYGPTPQCLVPPLDEKAWDWLGLTPSCLPPLVEALEASFDETLEILKPAKVQ